MLCTWLLLARLIIYLRTGYYEALVVKRRCEEDKEDKEEEINPGRTITRQRRLKYL